MLNRTLRMAAAAVVVLFVATGVVALPGAVLAAAFVALVLVGPVALMCSQSLQPGSGRAARTGLLAVVVTVALSAAVGGVVVLLGGVAASVVPALLVGAGVWMWSRRSDLVRRLRALMSGAPPAPDRTEPGPAARQSSRHRDRNPVEQRGSTVEEPPVADPVMATEQSTEQLCAAWQRSYWQLRELPAGRRYEQLARYRGDLLDEFERRDPDGFHRWLETSPRAGTHPGRYLPPDR